jgi:uncharacterized glyoxalase superfamily protein PhnB
VNIIDSELGIPTAEFGQCLRFYIDRLFFTKVSESSMECTVALGSDRVKFRRAHRDEVRSLRELGFALDFQVADIRAYFERVRAAGDMKFEQELELMQPGVWQFSVLDPNGYHVGFANERT